MDSTTWIQIGLERAAALAAALDPLEALGVAFGFVSVVLTVRRHIGCWPTGLANIALFLALFLRERLYGQVLLYLVFFAVSVYGWLHWRASQRAEQELRVLPMSPGAFSLHLAASAALTFALYFALRSFTNGAAPFLDALTTALSLVAQWLLARRNVGNWVFWITADVLYIVLFIQQKLWLTAALYGAFLLLAISGLIAWRRQLKMDSQT